MFPCQLIPSPKGTMAQERYYKLVKGDVSLSPHENGNIKFRGDSVGSL